MSLRRKIQQAGVPHLEEGRYLCSVRRGRSYEETSRGAVCHMLFAAVACCVAPAKLDADPSVSTLVGPNKHRQQSQVCRRVSQAERARYRSRRGNRQWMSTKTHHIRDCTRKVAPF
ncbi:hypothetical protein BD309DRAFT_254397 [Dichomitus squalens]|nr:hypothetical protein BD309DRAFT_254397 [Dichomitus squalens]